MRLSFTEYFFELSQYFYSLDPDIVFNFFLSLGQAIVC